MRFNTTYIALSAALLLLACGGAETAAASSSSNNGDSDGVHVKCEWPDFDAALERFSRILTFKTVSTPSTPSHLLDEAEFKAQASFLEAAFPRVFGGDASPFKVERLGVDGHSFLITWAGSDATLRPALMISHLDVVPVGAEGNWTYPPFSGTVAGGYVWGRGAMDVKVGVVALLEAASALAAEGFAPARTLLFAFGQDEEVGGAAGASKIAAVLKDRYGSSGGLDVIWDEGSGILADGVKPFTRTPVALVATSEKGYQSVHARISSPGGHSSMPPIDGSGVGDVAGRLLSALAAAPPAPRLVAPVTDMLRALAPYAPAYMAPLLAAVGRGIPGVDALVAAAMAKAGAEAASLVRTTAAATRFEAGVADNMLPQSGTVSINFRLLPGDTSADALAYLAGAAGQTAVDAGRVAFEPVAAGASPPAAVAPADGAWFRALAQATRAVYSARDGQPVAVVPFLLPGACLCARACVCAMQCLLLVYMFWFFVCWLGKRLFDMAQEICIVIIAPECLCCVPPSAPDAFPKA
jgi:carboxypeptidase PM20D1